MMVNKLVSSGRGAILARICRQILHKDEHSIHSIRAFRTHSSSNHQHHRQCKLSLCRVIEGQPAHSSQLKTSKARH